MHAVEEIAIKIGHFATYSRPWPWPWPWIGSHGIRSSITHWLLPTHQILLKLENFCGQTDRVTDGQTDPALLGRLGGVNLIIYFTFLFLLISLLLSGHVR